jgi:cell division protein FtsB
MSRNRKYRTAANRFGPALKAFLLCLIMGGSGVGYVWQKDQISQLGRQIKKREVRLAELKDQREKLKNQLEIMRSPRYLETRIKELNLSLVQPVPAQIWRLTEPPMAPKPAGTPENAPEQALAANPP